MTNATFINNIANLTSVFKGGAAVFVDSEVTLIVKIKDSFFQVNKKAFIIKFTSFIGKSSRNGGFR